MSLVQNYPFKIGGFMVVDIFLMFQHFLIPIYSPGISPFSDSDTDIDNLIDANSTK